MRFKLRPRPLVFLSLLAVFLFSSCTATPPGPTQAGKGPILIQGAMDMETGHLINSLEDVKKERFGSWSFWSGRLHGKAVVVSRTEIGMANAAAATALAVEKYRPRMILNQGTSGGHDPGLHTGDIVLGVKAVNTAAMRTLRKEAGQGIDTNDWEPFNIVLSLRGEDDEIVEAEAVYGHPRLIETAVAAGRDYTGGRVVKGIIGSSDQWNRELDRISQIRTRYNTSCEEMETAAAGLVAKAYNIPFLGIRILSNSEPHRENFDPDTALACQEFVSDLVKFLD